MKNIILGALLMILPLAAFAADEVAYGSSNVRLTNSSDLNNAISNARQPIVLMVTADWCAPCKIMKPVFDQLASESNGVLFLRADYDTNKDIARQFSVESIPAIVFIQPGGSVVGRTVGVVSKEELRGRAQALQRGGSR